ncbi:RDD family protein [Spirillospora sp. NPDC052269]
MDDVRPVLVVAGTARRVVGRVLDMVVVWATVAVLGLVVSPGLDKDETLATALMITMMAGSVAVVLLLRVTALALSGCTLGQRLAGTRVVDAGTVVVRAGRALGRPPG